MLIINRYSFLHKTIEKKEQCKPKTILIPARKGVKEGVSEGVGEGVGEGNKQKDCFIMDSILFAE